MSREHNLAVGKPTALAVSALTAAFLASTSGPAMAQAVPVEIEGPINAIECLDPAFNPPDCDQSLTAPGVLMTVMTVEITVPTAPRSPRRPAA